VRDSWWILNKGSFFDERQIPEKHRLAVADYLSSQNIERLFIESRPEFLSESSLTSFLERLRKTVKLTVGLGLEVSSQNILNLIRKGLDLKVFERCVKLLRSKDVNVQMFLMAGLPGANEPETSLESIRYAKRLGSNEIMISATVPRRGTILRAMWERREWKPIDITLFHDIVDSARTVFEPKNVDVWALDLRTYQSDAQMEAYEYCKLPSRRHQLHIDDFAANS
jgi:radical SAM enzyme (TIGR01210 family)